MKYILEKAEVVELKNKLLTNVDEFLKELFKLGHPSYMTGGICIDLTKDKFEDLSQDLKTAMEKTINEL